MGTTPSISRRKFVSGSFCLALASLPAGCLTPEEKTSYQIESIESLNRTTESHEIHIRISSSDNVFFSKKHTLTPEGSTSGLLINEEIPDERRPYKVEVRLNEGDWSTTVTPDQVSAECLKLLYLIEPVGDRNQTPLSAFVSNCRTEE